MMSLSGHPASERASTIEASTAAPPNTPAETALFSPRAASTVKASIVLVAAASLSTTFTFVFAGQLIHAVVTSAPGITTPLIGTITFAILASILSAVVIGLTGQAAGREEGHVRKRMLKYALTLGPVDRTSERSGSLASLASDGAERVALFKMTFFGPMIAAGITPVLVLAVVAIFIDWFSALILLIAVPAIPLLVGGFQMAFQKVSGKSREARQRLAAEYLDAIQGLTTLRLLNAAMHTQKKLAQSGEQNRRSIMSLLAVNQLVILIVDGVFSLFMVATVAWLAMTRLQGGYIDIGQAISLVLISLVLLEPLNKVGEFFYVGMGGLAAQRGIRRFLSTPVAVRSGTENLPKDLRGKNANDQPLVQFVDTTFAYGDLKVLDGLNLEIHTGEHVAIVGASGVGKSTIAALVQRNLPVADNQLIFAGVDANLLATPEARKLSATVGQTTFLFTGSLRENLLIAAPQATEAEMWEALDTANLRAEITAMPAGLDTIVGERGYSLSGGQAQRIAIARALLSQAPLLILDEPTSQVDLEGEAAILAAIEKAVKGRTVLTIAHRPSTLRSVDRVLRLSGGKLQEVPA